MASTTLISVEEYLNTDYRPDCDYLEGRVVERNLGEKEHGKMQGFLTYLFRLKREAWDVRVVPEQRVQVRAERYRIPDICVERRSEPDESIVRRPPLLCIEVLSNRDSLGSTRKRAEDYSLMGVPHVWAVDPWKRLAYDYRDGDFVLEAGALRIPGTPIQVSLAELFAELDA